MVEIVTFAGTLADAREHGVTTVRLGDVIDEFEDDDGLADAGAAERTGLAALDEGADQVDDLDAGLEDVGLGVLVGERRGRTVNRIALGMRDIAAAVHRRAGDVEDAAEDALADRHGDRGAGVVDRVATDEALGGGHGDRAHEAFAEVLLDLEGQRLLLAADGEVDGERLVNGRDGVLGELHVDDGADDLDDFALVAHDGEAGGVGCLNQLEEKDAAAISRISWVMPAWRALLYSRERSPISFVALSFAVFIATMRELCSEALALRTSW